MVGDDTFDRELRDVDWETMYERQTARGDLTARYCELLGLDAGDDVLELGSGPGYTTARLAEAVTPGTVYALDRRLGALRYLRQSVDRDTECIHPIGGDVVAPPLCFSEPIPTLAAFLLHHLERPESALEAIGSVLPQESPLLVVEYHPDAAGEVGPPLDSRITPAQVEKWLSGAELGLEESVSLPEEKYALLSRG